MTEVGEVTYKIRGDLSEFKKDLDSTKSEAEKAAKAMEDGQAQAQKSINTTAKATLVGIGAAAVAASGKAIQLGKDFETSLTKASTLFGDVDVDADNLSKGMLALSDSTGLAADSLGEALYNALSAGVPVTEDMGEALSYLEGSAKLAKAGFTDIDTASSATIKTLNAYGMGIEEADRVQKILIQTQNKGITTVGELGGVLAQVTPTAAAMNVSFEQVGASLALMTSKGTSTAQATTQLNSLLAELGKNGTEADKNFRAAAEGTELAGLSFTEAMEKGYTLSDVLSVMSDYADANGLSMLDMFSSIEAGKAALSISGDVETFNDDLAAMSTELDVVSEAADKMASTTEDKFNVALNELKNVLIELYQNVLQPLVIWFADAISWMAQHKDLIVAITIVLAALATGIIAYNACVAIATGATTMFATAAGALSAVLAVITSPIFLIIAAIGALIAIGYLLVTHWEEVKEFAIETWTAISEFFTEVFTAISEFFTEIWNSILEFLTGIWDSIKQVFIDVWNSLSEENQAWLTGIWENIQEIWNSILEFFTSIWEAINDAFTTAVEAVSDFLSNAWSSIQTAAETVWNAISSFFTSIWSDIQTTFDNACSTISGLFESFQTTVTNIWDAIKEVFNGVITFIRGVFTADWQTAWQGISDIFSGIANGLKSLFIGPINWIIDKINNFINGINNIQIPDWVPVVGGKGFNIPTIPHLKVGLDYVPSDMFPAFLHRGEAVLTAEQAALWRSIGRENGIMNTINNVMNNGGSTSFTVAKIADVIQIKEEADIDDLMEAMYQRFMASKRGRGLY